MCVLWMLFITTLMLSKAIAIAMNVSNSSRELKALKDFGWPYINSTAHHCNWEGITCDDHGRVAQISLQSKVGCDDKPWNCHDLGHLDPFVFTSLISIHLSSCGLYGVIPPHIGYLSNLSYLNLSNNQLNSQLPLSLANLSELRVLDISNNYYINGVIPPEIGSLSKLTHLDLSHNYLLSELPLSLENLTNLEVLDIYHSYDISGVIPPRIGSLLHLIVLDLNFNCINGFLPANMTQLTRLEILNLDGNSLEGVFEAGIQMLPCIKTIGLSKCSLKGRIPSQLGNVANAQFLNIDLSWNQLIGEVPISISSLEGIDLSNNNLEGEVPTNVWRKFGIESFSGNPKLRPPKEFRITVEIIYYLIFVFFILCGIYFIFFTRGRKGASSATPDPKHGDVFKIWNFDGNMAYQDIIEATLDFDLRYCIGTGAYGSVYRALLPTGRVVAVKKLHRFEGDTFDSSFRNEAEVLSQFWGQ